MINFVICEDEASFRKNTRQVIDKMFMKNKIEYEIGEFEKYNERLEKTINTPFTKIYLLDINLKGNISGIDIARKIRKVDWNSVIIFVTEHTEMWHDVIKAKVMPLDYISKFDECDKNIEKAIKKAIGKVNDKKVITFNANHITHKIYTDDIIYISKLPLERKCLIKTTYDDIIVSRKLCELELLLEPKFYMVHRSCIVNTAKIASVNWGKSTIKFINSETIDMLANDKKKGLKDNLDS